MSKSVSDDHTITYTYDATGIRDSKTVDGVKYTFYTSNGQVGRQYANGKYWTFLYDNQGRPNVLIYDGTVYYYVLNLQGDVIGLVNTSGTYVAQYAYDAWGKCISSSGTLADVNPLRYRGYYYDSETGFYYLGSRYYDPAIKRFINADGQFDFNAGLHGYNLFTYCSNNPVCFQDSSGEALESAFDVVTLAVSVSNAIENPLDPWLWICVVGDAVDLIPIVTGIGEALKATRAIKYVDDVIDGYGVLSKAKTYGVHSYKTLRKMLKGTGLQAHHIIEVRLVKHLDIDVNDMLSVAVTPAEHQQFTNAWRSLIRYGSDYSKLTVDDIWGYAQQVYKDYPQLLKAAKEILYGKG